MFDLAGLEAARAIVAPPHALDPDLCLAAAGGADRREVWVKHENHTPTGAFKVRGGLVYAPGLARDGARPAGLISATRGNHGQSLAFAGARRRDRGPHRRPARQQPEKNAAMRALGAELIEHGQDFDEAQDHATAPRRRRGACAWCRPSIPTWCAASPPTRRSCSRAVADLHTVYVPIGMGSGICALIAHPRPAGPADPDRRRRLRPARPRSPCRSAEGRGRHHRPRRHLRRRHGLPRPRPGRLRGDPRRRRADRAGDRRRSGGRHPPPCGRTRTTWPRAPGPPRFAALLQEADAMRGRRVAVVLSGGNIDLEVARRVLFETRAA